MRCGSLEKQLLAAALVLHPRVPFIGGTDLIGLVATPRLRHFLHHVPLSVTVPNRVCVEYCNESPCTVAVSALASGGAVLVGGSTSGALGQMP